MKCGCTGSVHEKALNVTTLRDPAKDGPLLDQEENVFQQKRYL